MRIIRADDREGRLGVRDLVLSSPKRIQPVIVPDPIQLAMDDLRQQVETLSDQLAAKERALAALRQDLIDVRKDSLAEGRAAGLGEAETREAERLEAVQHSLAEGAAKLAATLEALQPLAVLVAREGLEKILGDPEAYPDQIARIVRRQLRGLKDQSALAIEVSGEDFPGAEALAQLGESLALPVGSVVAGKDVASGSCRIRLKLGTVEVGVRPQWDRLSQLLRELVEEGAS